MSTKTNGRATKKQLRLVSSIPPPAVGKPTGASISAAPFRPGELPIISWIPLDAETRTIVRHAADAAGIPIELWVRVAVEASRLVSEIATLSGNTEAAITSLLNCAAQDGTDEAPTNLAALTLTRYAEELGEARLSGEPDPEMPVRLPEEMNAAWSRAAANERLGYGHWVGSKIAAAPSDCVQWEIAAARGCKSMGEWAYASSLRASAISKA